MENDRVIFFNLKSNKYEMSGILNGDIQRMSRKTPLKSKIELFRLLFEWKTLNNDKSDSKTIGNSEIGVTPLIWLKEQENLYKINSDTNLGGVREFLSNFQNEWFIIPNKRGTINKVTNDKNKIGISGFYMYKILK